MRAELCFTEGMGCCSRAKVTSNFCSQDTMGVDILGGNTNRHHQRRVVLTPARVCSTAAHSQVLSVAAPMLWSSLLEQIKRSASLLQVQRACKTKLLEVGCQS